MQTNQVAETTKTVLADGEGLRLQSGPGRDLIFKVTGDDTGGAFDYFIVEVSPRSGPPLHVHHLQEETIHVLKGHFKIRIGDEIFYLKEGGFAYLPSKIPHAFLNMTDELGEVIVVYTPGGGHHFYEELGPLTRNGRPDPKVVAGVFEKHGMTLLGPPLSQDWAYPVYFFPDKLSKDYKFSFAQTFDELNIATKDGKLLNGLLFKADSVKGLVFYLYGNTGSLSTWGDVAKRYADLHYSVFLLNYPGYGKSEGAIENMTQLFDAIQSAYDEMKRLFNEDSIVVLGYSVGTGPAAHLAATNHPKLLILQAPYYWLADMMRHRYPIIPTFLLKYRFQTNEYLKGCKMAVVIFHGDRDEVIYYGSSLKLKNEMKTGDTLITLYRQGHNGITDNPDYIKAIQTILK